MMLVLIGRFTAKSEKISELINLANSLFQPSRAEAGCISYRFYQDTETSNDFIFLEEWQSRADLDLHFQTSHFKSFMEQFSEMIVGTPSVKCFEIESVEDLF